MPLEPQKTTRKTYDRFVKNWKDSLRDAQQVASQNIERAAAANKRQYDQRIKHVAIEVGDRVLVHNLTPKGGTGKLRSWWEQKIYEVVEKREKVPVFKVKPVGGGLVRTLHRNLLMKVDHLPLDAFGEAPTGLDQSPDQDLDQNLEQGVLAHHRPERDELDQEVVPEVGAGPVLGNEGSLPEHS